MSSQQRRTFDTDIITLRTVNIRGSSNSLIPGGKVLTSDGLGGTVWVNPSTATGLSAFQQIITDAGTYTANSISTTFLLNSGQGIGMTQGAPGSNQTYIYAKAFSEVDISGNNTLYAYSNATLTPAIKFAGTGGIGIRSDCTTNTVFFDSIAADRSTISLLAFSKAFVLSNTSTVSAGISSLENKGTYLNAASPSSVIKYIGLGDIILTVDSMQNAIYFGMNQSTNAVSTLTSLVNENYSTISSIYTPKTDFSTAIIQISTNNFAYTSTSVSTSIGLTSNLSIVVYNLPFGDYTLLQQTNNLTAITQAGLSSLSTTMTYPTALFSTSLSLQNQISSLSQISTLCSITLYGGDFSIYTAGTVIIYPTDQSTFLLSTVAGLGTASYISSSALSVRLNSTIQGLGSLGFVSSLNAGGYILTSNLNSTVEGLGSIGFLSSISSMQPVLNSTLIGLGTLGFLSTVDTTLFATTSNVTSTIVGLGTFGFVSSITSVQPTINSTLKGLGTFGFLSSATGGSGSGILSLSTNFTTSILNLGYTDFNKSIPMYLSSLKISNSNETTPHAWFSTGSVILDPFSTYINSNSIISLRFYYNYVFDSWNSLIYLSNDTPETRISPTIPLLSQIMYGNTTIEPNTSFIENLQANPNPSYTASYYSYTDATNYNVISYTSNSSNIYTGVKEFQLTTSNVMTSYMSSISLFHSLSSGIYYHSTVRKRDVGIQIAYLTGYSGFNTSTLLVNMPSTNSIYLSIYNSGSTMKSY
jgi:hypothetical protein